MTDEERCFNILAKMIKDGIYYDPFGVPLVIEKSVPACNPIEIPPHANLKTLEDQIEFCFKMFGGDKNEPR